MHFTVGDSASPPQQGPVSDVIVENSLIENSIYTAVDCTPGPCDRMTFRHLEIRGAGRGGEGNWGADGLAIERGRDILVEDCYVHDNSGDGIDLNSRDIIGQGSGILVRRNEVVRNQMNGIKLGAGGRVQNFHVRLRLS
jgi:polygalacturonase